MTDLIQLQTNHASAQVSLFGAQVLSYIRHGDERLFVSPNAIFDQHTAIRGGVPVCWPWFADMIPSAMQTDTALSLPNHGFVRTQHWQLSAETRLCDLHRVTLVPTSNVLSGYRSGLNCKLIVTLDEQLSIELVTENHTDQTLSFTAALHSYFRVNNIHAVQLEGLSGPYLDKLAAWKSVPTPSPYTITAEVDRIHQSTARQVKIVEKGRAISVTHNGHDSLVIWNPWSKLSQSMADMEADGYCSMLCVETAVTQPYSLAAGAKHHLQQVIA